ITVTFRQGYNLDIAAVDVLNRVSIVTPQLPQEVQRTGVTVRNWYTVRNLLNSSYQGDRRLA
ncbi:MAG: hypothetical protein F6K42_25500, partial [Leptolyngbya sp. SIO1D8]|nr:hypothetical protein [Leptolyngbya sp. SIO1D8]